MSSGCPACAFLAERHQMALQARDRAEEQASAAENMMSVMQEQRDVLLRRYETMRSEARRMEVDRDHWRETAERNRGETREVEAAAAAEARALRAEIARLREATFPADRRPPDVSGLDDAAARYALIEIDKQGDPTCT